MERATSILRGFPAFFKFVVPKEKRRTGKPEKLPDLEQKNSIRNDDYYAQLFPILLDDFLQRDISVAERLTRYKAVTSSENGRKPVYSRMTFNDQSGNYYLGHPYDFSSSTFSTVLPSEHVATKQEPTWSEVAFTIYLEQRMLLSFLDICIELGEATREDGRLPSRKRQDPKARLGARLTRWEVEGLVASATPSEDSSLADVIAERLSPFDLLNNQKLLKALLYRKEYFLNALHIEPCLLQTSLGLRSLKSFSLISTESVRDLARHLAAARPRTPPPTEHFVKRALLILKSFEPELMQSPEFQSKDLHTCLVRGGVIARPGLITANNIKTLKHRMFS